MNPELPATRYLSHAFLPQPLLQRNVVRSSASQWYLHAFSSSSLKGLFIRIACHGILFARTQVVGALLFLEQCRCSESLFFINVTQVFLVVVLASHFRSRVLQVRRE